MIYFQDVSKACIEDKTFLPVPVGLEPGKRPGRGRNVNLGFLHGAVCNVLEQDCKNIIVISRLLMSAKNKKNGKLYKRRESAVDAIDASARFR